jgi:hypothetical protein
MGSGITKIARKIDPFATTVATKVGDPILGQLGLPNLSGQDGGRAEAAAKAAERQAQAQRDAANVQSAALRDQTAAAVAAQVATINQQAMAAQLASRAQDQPQEGAPDVQLDNATDAGDPRRKYRGGTVSIGGTSGGVGIRL